MTTHDLSDFSQHTLNDPGDGNWGLDLGVAAGGGGSTNPASDDIATSEGVTNILELANMYGGNFNKADADGTTWKWTAQYYWVNNGGGSADIDTTSLDAANIEINNPAGGNSWYGLVLNTNITSQQFDIEGGQVVPANMASNVYSVLMVIKDPGTNDDRFYIGRRDAAGTEKIACGSRFNLAAPFETTTNSSSTQVKNRITKDGSNVLRGYYWRVLPADDGSWQGPLDTDTNGDDDDLYPGFVMSAGIGITEDTDWYYWKVNSGTLGGSPYRTAGNSTTQTFDAGSEVVTTISGELANADATFKIDKIELYSSAGLQATTNSITSSGVFSLTSTDLASGSLAGMTGAGCYAKIYFVGDGTDSCQLLDFSITSEAPSTDYEPVVWSFYYNDGGWTEDTDAIITEVTDNLDRYAKKAKVLIIPSSGRTIADDYPTFSPVRIYYDLNDGAGNVLKMVGFVAGITEGQNGATLDILGADFLLRRRDDIFRSYSSKRILYVLEDLIRNYSPLEWVSDEYEAETTAEFDTGTKEDGGDGNYKIETYTDNTFIDQNCFQLANMYGDNFTYAVVDFVANPTWKWPVNDVRGNNAGAVADIDTTVAGGLYVNVTTAAGVQGWYDIDLGEKGTGAFGLRVNINNSNSLSNNAYMYVMIYQDANNYAYIGFRNTGVDDIYAESVVGGVSQTANFATPDTDCSFYINRSVTDFLDLGYDLSGGDGNWTILHSRAGIFSGDCYIILSTIAPAVNGQSMGGDFKDFRMLSAVGTLTNTPFRTSGYWLSANFPANTIEYDHFEVEVENATANYYVDQIDILKTAAIKATITTNLVADETYAIYEDDLTSGTFVGLTGSDIQAKVTLAGDGSDSAQINYGIIHGSDNIEVENNREITREWRGQRLDAIIQELSTLSGNEMFGANNDLEFFFIARDLTSAPLSFSDNNIIYAEREGDEKEAIDRVIVFYNSGANAISSTKFGAAANNQSTFGTANPIYRTATYDHPEITAEATAKQAADAYLNQKNTTDIIYIDTIEFPDLEPGQVVKVTSSDLHITSETEYVISEITWDCITRETKVKLIENSDGVIDVISALLTEKTRVDMKTSAASVVPVETNNIQQAVQVKITNLKILIAEHDTTTFRFGTYGKNIGANADGGPIGSSFTGYSEELNEDY